MSYSSPSDFQFPLPELNLTPLMLPQKGQTPTQLRLLATASIEKFNSDRKQVFKEVINTVLPGGFN